MKIEYGGRDAIRQEHPLARPKKQKSRVDEDDEPVYLDEETQNSISKDEYEMLISRHEDKHSGNQGLPSSLCSPDPQAEGTSDNKIESHNITVLLKQQEAGIGRNPKKRLAKVIGDDHKVEDIQKSDNSSRKYQSISKPRKLKKVKLCFEEDIES